MNRFLAAFAPMAVGCVTAAAPPTGVRVLDGGLDGEPYSFVASGERVLFTVRARDFVGVHHERVHHERELLVLVTQDGGPGTCVWSKRAEVYELVDSEVWPRQEALLGGYLECADGSSRACGCGTWEADWRLSVGRDHTAFTTEPRLTSEVEGSPSAPLPSPVTLEL